MDRLLPCPFCGGAAKTMHIAAGIGKRRWAVYCVNGRCIARGLLKKYETEDGAVADWNRRKEAGR